MERTGHGQMCLEESRCSYGDAKFAMRASRTAGRSQGARRGDGFFETLPMQHRVF